MPISRRPPLSSRRCITTLARATKNIASRTDSKMPTMQEVEMLRKLTGITKDISGRHLGFYKQAFEELAEYIPGSPAGSIRSLKHRISYSFLPAEFAASHDRTHNSFYFTLSGLP